MIKKFLLVGSGFIIGAIAVALFVYFNFKNIKKEEIEQKKEVKITRVESDIYQIQKVGELDIDPDCSDGQAVYIKPLE